jgi:hypothetical protein
MSLDGSSRGRPRMTFQVICPRLRGISLRAQHNGDAGVHGVELVVVPLLPNSVHRSEVFMDGQWEW